MTAIRDPDLKGPAGRAWQLHWSEEKQAESPAGVAAWLIHAPGSHPFWPWHLLYCVHLREIEGSSPPVHKIPDASHEFGLMAIDPEKCPEPDPDKHGDGFPLLEPPDVCTQVAGLDDVQAIRLCLLLVEQVVRGWLIADVDDRRRWVEAIEATAKHYCEGMHEPS